MGSILKLLTFAMLCLAASPAADAASIESAYTKVELDRCQAEPPPATDDPVTGGTWWCNGYGGMPVRVAEGDLRYLVSYGKNAADEFAAGQTLGPFNRIGSTIEWRLKKSSAGGAGQAFATILRYFTDAEGGPEGQVLVVTKLGGAGQICHIGYVDAVLNKNANALARQLADERAPGFVCGKDEAENFGLTAD